MVPFPRHEVPTQREVRVSRTEAAPCLMVYLIMCWLVHWSHFHMCRRSLVMVWVEGLPLGCDGPGNVQQFAGGGTAGDFR